MSSRMTGPDYAVMCNLINKHTHTPWEDQCEWHKMTRMTRGGLRGYVQFNKYTHTHTHNNYNVLFTNITYLVQIFRFVGLARSSRNLYLFGGVSVFGISIRYYFD